MKTKTIALLAALLIVIIFSATLLDDYADKNFKAKTTVDYSASALLDILGELRYTAAALLWMKTDYYHHEYEFAGKPLNINEPIMPLIRLITLLDPHFVQAYDFGAYHLAVNLRMYKESMNFLKEGLTYNPNSFELNWEYGFLLYMAKNYSEALPYLLKARELREQKTPSYDDFMKVVWVNSRIIDSLEHIGQSEKAEFYQFDLN